MILEVTAVDKVGLHSSPSSGVVMDFPIATCALVDFPIATCALLTTLYERTRIYVYEQGPFGESQGTAR